MPADLTDARRVAELQLADTCTITRDSEGNTDAVLDTATGTLTHPAGDTTTIYTGVCLITQIDRGDQPRPEGGQELYRAEYRARIPVDAPAVQIGDTLTVTGAANDPNLEGVAFRVIDVLRSTLPVTRRLELVTKTRGPVI